MKAVHAGSCLAVPRVPTRGIARRSVALGVEYCLHDVLGRPVGTIPAPAVRPFTGPAAPTFYLRRSR